MKAALKAMFTKEKIQYHAPVWVCLLFIAWLAILPTGYQEIYREAEQCVAKVILGRAAMPAGNRQWQI